MAQVIKDIVTWLTQWFTPTDDLADVALSNSYDDLDNKPTIKTINNESLVGSGNITISVDVESELEDIVDDLITEAQS